MIYTGNIRGITKAIQRKYKGNAKEIQSQKRKYKGNTKENTKGIQRQTKETKETQRKFTRNIQDIQRKCRGKHEENT